MTDDNAVRWWARTMGRAVYIRDDLDGYGAVLAWDGPSRAEGERVTVTDVTLAYDATGPVLSGITIAYPGQPTFPAPPLPLAGETVEAWKARTGAPGSMTDAGDAVVVRTALGEVRARRVILATNAFPPLARKIGRAHV